MATASVVLGVLAFGVADERAVLGATAAVFMLLAHRLMRTSWYAKLPRFVLNGLLITIALVSVGTINSQFDLNVSRFAWFLISILFIKVFDRRKSRDEGQLLTAAVFLCLATALTGVSLTVGLLLLAMVVVLLDASLRLQETVAAEAAGQGAPSFGRRPPFKRLSTVAALAVITISIGVFVAVPRQLIEGSLSNIGQQVTRGSTTGFTDQINLGSRGIISENTTPVLDLRLEDATGNTLGGPGQFFHLRGAVLDTYDAGRWRVGDPSERGSRIRMNAGVAQSFTLFAPNTVAVLVQRIVFKNADPADQTLFAVWRPYSLQLSTNGTVRRLGDGVLKVTSGANQFSYTIWSSELDNRRRIQTRIEAEPLNLPALNEWARQALRDAGIEPDPAFRAPSTDSRAARALSSAVSKAATYTLSPPRVPNGEDPTEWFLFEGREGHCEYFASALAAACRAVGIRSRVVAGYVTGEFNESGGYYVVRESNAHAWVEASVGGDLWITLDPTPSADLRAIHQPEPTLFSRVGNVFQAVEYAWLTRVVDFGSDTVWSPPELSEAGRRSEGRAGALQRQWQVWVVVSGLVAALAMSAWLVVSRLGRRALPTGSRELLRLWASAERALRRAQVPRPSWRSPLDHAAEVETLGVEAGRRYEAFARAMYAARFDSSSDDDLSEGRRLLGELVEALRRSRTDRSKATGR